MSHIVLIGLLVESDNKNNNKYKLTVVDHYSAWGEVYPIKRKIAAVVKKVPSHDNFELTIIMGRRSGYGHCTVTIANDAVYDNIQEQMEGQNIIMSSGTSIDVRCQVDIPRRIILREGVHVHLLHVQHTCMYATDMWMLKPIRHLH